MHNTIPVNASGRRMIFTPQYYRDLKETNNIKWAEVDFVCHHCGDIFHVSKVKPHAMPVNCSPACRMNAFNPRIGLGTTDRVKLMDWDLAKAMVNRGDAGPKIAAKLDISLPSLHRHIKKRFGSTIYNKLIANGIKSRKRGQLAAIAKKTKKA